MRRYRFKRGSSREETLIDAVCESILNREPADRCAMTEDDERALREEMGLLPFGPPMVMYGPAGEIKIERCNGVKPGEFQIL